jgi:hypothetical protein
MNDGTRSLTFFVGGLLTGGLQAALGARLVEGFILSGGIVFVVGFGAVALVSRAKPRFPLTPLRLLAGGLLASACYPLSVIVALLGLVLVGKVMPSLSSSAINALFITGCIGYLSVTALLLSLRVATSFEIGDKLGFYLAATLSLAVTFVWFFCLVQVGIPQGGLLFDIKFMGVICPLWFGTLYTKSAKHMFKCEH